jgi:hypothetical protein
VSEAVRLARECVMKNYKGFRKMTYSKLASSIVLCVISASINASDFKSILAAECDTRAANVLSITRLVEHTKSAEEKAYAELELAKKKGDKAATIRLQKEWRESMMKWDDMVKQFKFVINDWAILCK